VKIVKADLKSDLDRFSRDEWEKQVLRYPFSFEREHFLACEGDRIVGRIAANRSERDPSRGYVGFFRVEETVDRGRSVAHALFQQAESWLKARGVLKCYGPVNYHTLFDYRLRLPDRAGDPEAPSFFWEPSQPSGQVDWFEAHGYVLHEEYHSRAYRNLDSILPKSSKRYQGALDAGFSTRPIELVTEPAKTLAALVRINSGSFAESALAEPFDSAAYRALVAPRFTGLLSEFSFFILNPAGEEIGYFFLFQESGVLVWKTLAILPEYQGAGLAAFGIHHALLLAEKHGIKEVVSALIRKGAQSEHLLKRGEEFLVWEHRYGVFVKEL
jgi:GNAT superfamily N-acetyltransferase